MVFQTDDEVDGDADDEIGADDEYDPERREKERELISKKLQKDKGAAETTESREEEREKKFSRR